MAAPNQWGKFLAAIRAQESGGNYTQDSAGCLGAYCWNAQSNWDSMAHSAGLGHYAGQNPATVPPKIQDEVASRNLYRIYQQTHSMRDAAAWWNGGSIHDESNPGLPAQPWAKSCGGGSSYAYACQVLARMRLGGHYLAGGGTGAGSVGGSGAGGTITLTAAQQADCMIGFPNANPVPSWVPFLGHSTAFCLLTKSTVRGLAGVGMIIAGGLVMFGGTALLAAAGAARVAAPVVAQINAVPVVGSYTRAATGAASKRLSYTPKKKAPPPASQSGGQQTTAGGP